MIDPKSPRAAKVQDYETALRIGQKLASAGVTPDEMFDYVQSLGGDRRYSDASIDAFLAERTRKEERRTQNIVERQKTETRLFGREDLYRRYLSLLKDERRLGLSPHGEVESELYDAYLGEKKYIYAKQPNAVDTLSLARDQLQADLMAAGFPSGIADFEKFVKNYEAAFERETLTLAFDILRRYEHYLHQEHENFAPGKIGPTSEAGKVLQSIEKIRQPAQALYDTARRETTTASNLKTLRPYARTDEEARDDDRQEAEARRQAAEHEKQAEESVAGAVPEHALVGWQDFPREKLLHRATAEDVRYEIAWFIDTHDAAIGRARQLLADKPERIYQLDNLLAVSYAAQDITTSSIYDLIVRNRIERIESEKSIREMLVALITIALSIVSLGGGTLGLIAAGATFGIGLAQAADAIEDYDTKTTLYLAQLLSDKPSAAWAILAVMGTALDAGAIMHALAVVVPAAEAFNEAGDLIKLKNALQEVDARVRDSVMKAAEQVRGAEQELKAASGQLKEMFKKPSRLLFGSPSTVKSVVIPGGELLGNLVSITYYYVKSRLLKSFPRFVEQLERDGLIVWAQLAVEDQTALRKAFDEAIEINRVGQLPFGTPIYENLSPRAREVFSAESVDRLAAEGKGLGKSEQEIIEQLESEAASEPPKVTRSSEAIAADREIASRGKLSKLEEDQRVLEAHRDSARKELQAETKRNRQLQPGIAQKFKPTQEFLDSSKRVEKLKAGLADAEKQVVEHARQIKQAEGELALITKPWRQAERVGLNEAETNFRVGLFGELETTAILQEQGWEPIGNTFQPSDIVSPKHFDDAVKRYRGRTGIDGIYRRVRDGKTEYLIAESKATLNPQAELATGKGLLSATDTGDQLSKSWIRGNLHKTGLSPAEVTEIEGALAEDKVRLVYSQTRGNETNLFTAISDTDMEATIVGSFDPSL